MIPASSPATIEPAVSERGFKPSKEGGQQKNADFQAWVEESPLEQPEQQLADLVGQAEAIAAQVPTAIEQWTLFEWAALSTYRLSQKGAAALHLTTDASAGATPNAVTQGAGLTAGSAQVPDTGSVSLSSPAPGKLQSLPLSSTRELNALSHEVGRRRAEQQVTILESGVDWKRRLFRHVEDESGQLSLWVRDYSLDAAQLEGLLAQIRQERPDLARIVVNGQLVWASGSDESRQGDAHGH